MKILFLGDFFYDYDYETEDFSKIVQYITEHNYKVILNLETSVCSCDKPIKKRGPNLQSSPTIIDLLKKMQCICVCLANNHAMDYGEDSLVATIKRLQEAGIACIGAGKDINEAIKPVVISDEDTTIVIQNYGWDIEETVYASEKHGGCAPLMRKKIVQRTYELRKQYSNAKIINIFHWGFEYNTLPMPCDIQFAHDCIHAGCDLIIGHHPHVIQPFEIFDGKRIFYSLGNFYFGSRRDVFPDNFQNELYQNYADYGLGVIWDTNTDTYQAICVNYERENKKTAVIENGDYVLPNFSGKNWNDESYLELAKQHAYKPNPILGLDERDNAKQIFILKTKYIIASKLRLLIRFPIGKKLYDFLKSKA